MPTDVIMPQMGESIFEGTITKWLKQPGEKVQRDEPLFEISTDKVDAEIPAPASGTLQDIKVQAGTTVQVNTVVGTIAEEGACGRAKRRAGSPLSRPRRGGDGSRATPSEAAQPPSSEEAPRRRKRFLPIFPTARKSAWSGNSRARSRKYNEAGEQERVRSSPLVRRMAKDNNVDLTKVSGTGVGGRITKDDIEAFIAKHGAGAPAATPAAAPAARPLPLRSSEPVVIASAARRRRHAGRSRTHVGDAQENCRAHGDVEAHQRACAWHLRGRRYSHRQDCARA